MAGTTQEKDDFVDVGRTEMHEQRDKLQALMFSEKRVDKEAVTAYLSNLFSSKQAASALERLRKQIIYSGKMVLEGKMNVNNLVVIIKGLIYGTGLLEENARTALREVLNNSIVLEELTNALNMRLASLTSWKWPESGIPVRMRHHMNGEYRAFTDPDILDALMLHYLGLSWQSELKYIFNFLYRGNSWKHPKSPFTKLELTQKRGQLGCHSEDPSISSQQKLFRDAFFLTQLTDSWASITAYDDRANHTRANSMDKGIKINDHMEDKQKMLHLLTTELYLNMAFYGTHAVVCSDLEWFGPSLSHETVLLVFEFLGFSRTWLNFFETFLRAPLRLGDDPTGEVRLRRCGTPVSYALSVVCSEAVLFLMDYAVNQKTEGLFLHRMHGGLWLWDSNPLVCASAWLETDLMGLTFNKGKTGSVVMGTYAPTELPAGSVRWGFLVLDPHKGRFIIDQGQVDEHIVELRHQLSTTHSIFGWVNVYNKYMEFMLRNFGGIPAK